MLIRFSQVIETKGGRGFGEGHAPEPRAKQPPDMGAVIEIAEVGGLHHRYERRAA